jgi:corrinoid protein of di/trimethylamine methyltransferase
VYSDSSFLRTQPIFAIGLASIRLGLSFSALRMYEGEGLLLPYRTSTGRRIYSLADLEWIDCIRNAIKERGLNIEGIREILSLIPCWDIYQCSVKVRESCEGYLSSLKPCWYLMKKACSRGVQDCRACDVYLKAAMWLNDPKGFWKEISESKARLQEDLKQTKSQITPIRKLGRFPLDQIAMASQQRKQEVLKKLSDGVVNFNESVVKEAAQEALNEGIDAFEAIMDGLGAGMEVVGELYNRHEYFVPELLLSADALYAGLSILKPHVKSRVGEALTKGKVVIGTVEGDVHDIGKNIVKMMFEVAGFTVYDLGKDVPLERFVEEQIRTDSEIVALSAMMTTTMIGMKKVVQMIKEKNPNVPIMLGGAPLNPEVAEEYGADGYAESAGNAVQEAIKIISQFRKIRKERKFHNDDASLRPTGVDLPEEVKPGSKGASWKR